ncbi:MAG: hypothetical protein H7067_08160 [Burkholderiales bacterium]|nr:hypothetical protein [Opitutaceae bacterium]
MPTASQSAAEHKTPAATSAGAGRSATRRADAEALKVAQIYALIDAKSYPTGDAALVVQIGDPECAPHRHGIRASRLLWADIIARLLAGDPALAAAVKARG